MDKPRVASGCWPQRSQSLVQLPRSCWGHTTRRSSVQGLTVFSTVQEQLSGLPWRRGLRECILEGAVRGSQGRGGEGIQCARNRGTRLHSGAEGGRPPGGRGSSLADDLVALAGWWRAGGSRRRHPDPCLSHLSVRCSLEMSFCCWFQGCWQPPWAAGQLLAPGGRHRLSGAGEPMPQRRWGSRGEAGSEVRQTGDGLSRIQKEQWFAPENPGVQWAWPSMGP